MRDVTIVVGTIGQSIMRSEDNGQTWARVGPRRGFAYEAAVRCIAMHPKQHKILFASTEKGIYRSEDGGANWQRVESALDAHYVGRSRSTRSIRTSCLPVPARRRRRCSFVRKTAVGHGTGGRWKSLQSARRSARRGLPGSPSIRSSPIIFGRASKWTAPVIAATAATPGASSK